MLNILEAQDIANIQLSDDQQMCLANIASQIDALNSAMRSAVESGMTIELRRSARHHQDGGNWGDIIAPMVHTK
jgi:hypothetical protein